MPFQRVLYIAFLSCAIVQRYSDATADYQGHGACLNISAGKRVAISSISLLQMLPVCHLDTFPGFGATTSSAQFLVFVT